MSLWKGKAGMQPETTCRTVRQYSREPVCREDMEKLLEIAADYGRVKNYVYARYSGVGSLSKLWPGYTVQNEMTSCGLRSQLGLPSVYFYLAVFDALGDIKGQWTRTKSKLLELIAANGNFTEEEKHYLRFLLKVNNAFEAVLNQRPMELQKGIQKQHDELARQVDQERLRRYLCRQVRRYHLKNGKPHTESADGFSIAERAYRYGDHGIYLSVKEKRKRIFVPLTDNNQYGSQLYISLYPEESRIEIKVPVNVAVRKHEDYEGVVGAALGMYVMLTTDSGHRYGESLGKYQTEYAAWVREQARIYSRSRKDNPGRKKYRTKKRRYEEQLHSYINRELNRFLREEKPGTVYIPKLPGPRGGGRNKKINQSVSMWQRGYIRGRLVQKCMEQSVELAEILGKGISAECSCCGGAGEKKEGIFCCRDCGYTAEEKVNTARNALKRGVEGKIIRQTGHRDNCPDKFR